MRREVANKRRIHERGAANLRVIVVRAAPSDSAVAENCNKKHVCRVASRRVGFSLLRRRLTLQSRIKTAITQRISLTGSICNTIRDNILAEHTKDAQLPFASYRTTCSLPASPSAKHTYTQGCEIICICIHCLACQNGFRVCAGLKPALRRGALA
jgi:hypothetical protein